jgi:hypothetical protein
MLDFRDPDYEQRRALRLHLKAIAAPGIREPILEYLEKNVEFPHSDRCKRFKRDFAPHLKRVIEAYGKHRVVSYNGPVGAGKTTAIEAVTAFIIGANPGPTLIVGQSDDDVQDWAETRLMKMLDHNPATRNLMPTDHTAKRKTSILFPHMAMFLGGANMNTLQSKSMVHVILDEVWRFKPGMVSEADGRTHNRPNSCVFALGQGGLEGDEHWKLHETTDKHEYHWKCEGCSGWVNYGESFGPNQTIIYDLVRDTEGNTLYAPTAKTVRMRCPHCKAEYPDTEEVRRRLATAADYRPVQSNPMPGRLGLQLDATGVWWIPWSELALMWIVAQEKKHNGDLTELIKFRQKRQARYWNPEMEAPDVILQSGGYSSSDYQEKLIEGEAGRFFTIDRQRDHFWAVIRAWCPGGASKQLYSGRLLDWNQLPELAKKYQVQPRKTFIDARYDPSASYAFCAANGYVSFMGDNRSTFIHADHKGGKSHRFYSTLQWVQLGNSKIPLFFWSNEKIKDILGYLRAGRIAPFEIPSDAHQEYPSQMASEVKRDIVNKITGSVRRLWVPIGSRANHLWDCECMQVVAAMMLNLLTIENVEAAGLQLTSDDKE